MDKTGWAIAGSIGSVVLSVSVSIWAIHAEIQESRETNRPWLGAGSISVDQNFWASLEVRNFGEGAASAIHMCAWQVHPGSEITSIHVESVANDLLPSQNMTWPFTLPSLADDDGFLVVTLEYHQVRGPWRSNWLYYEWPIGADGSVTRNPFWASASVEEEVGARMRTAAPECRDTVSLFPT